MEWSTDIPTDVGFFWLWDGGDEIQVVEIVKYEYPRPTGSLEVHYCGHEQTDKLDSFAGDGYFWSGPLSHPELLPEGK